MRSPSSRSSASRKSGLPRLSVLLGALLLVLAACGGADESAEEVTEPATDISEATSEPLATEPATEDTGTTTDVTEDADATEGTDTTSDAAATTDDLTTALQGAGLGSVAAAIESAGLTEQLEQLPEFTLFAPNDDAFAAMSADLSSLDPAEVQDILAYHVVDQRLLSSDLQEGENTVTTLQGTELTVTVEGGEVTVGDGATVTQTDVEVGDTGVVHVIDQILMPSA